MCEAQAAGTPTPRGKATAGESPRTLPREPFAVVTNCPSPQRLSEGRGKGKHATGKGPVGGDTPADNGSAQGMGMLWAYSFIVPDGSMWLFKIYQQFDGA